jgi:hypothetical protein
MASDSNEPKLYGIVHSNRSGAALWGKNQFNSTFPAALACYMRNIDMPAVYLTLSDDLSVVASDLRIGELFNTELPNDKLRFDFEAKYDPYQQYALDDIGGIDLVIKHHDDTDSTAWRRALEVKLTVMPDNTTCLLPEQEWSPELVIRPASTKYCALGIYHDCKEDQSEIRYIFQNVCGNFREWNSVDEFCNKRDQLLDALNQFQIRFRDRQKPFLVQPVWKTEGKTPWLAAQAFDVFIWSDFALCRTFIKALEETVEVNRSQRAAARLARTLYSLATQERANLNPIYTGMAYGLQTDKEFALSGQMTKVYLNTPRRLRPELPREVIAKVILNGGERLLSPERRFDATIFFTARTLFEVEAAEQVGIMEGAAGAIKQIDLASNT